MGMAVVLYYMAEACQVLGFLVVLPGACAPAYRWARKHPCRVGYRPRHARAGRDGQSPVPEASLARLMRP